MKGLNKRSTLNILFNIIKKNKKYIKYRRIAKFDNNIDFGK